MGDGDVVAFLQDLVRIPSVCGTHDETAVAHRIQEEAKKLGIECTLYASPEAPTRMNAVASIGSGPPLFLFAAHSDTVALGRLEDWKSPPMDADGQMIGRGTADNKGGIAAALYSLHDIQKKGILKPGQGRIFVAGVADEESGACSDHGLAYLLKHGHIGGTGAIYCHIGSRVTIGHRGLIRVTIGVHGQAVHSGGEKGSNASMALCEALVKIEAHRWPLALHDAFPRLRFTVTPGTILRGGEWESMVPPYAESMLDIRTMPGQDQDEIIAQITSIVDTVIKGRNEKILSLNNPKVEPNPQLLSFKITIKNKLPSAHIPINHPLAQSCVESVKELLGEDVSCGGCGPANEGYMLIGAGIPTICGFGYNGGHPHAPNEWVDVDSLKKTVDVYTSVVRKYCKI